MIEIIEGGKASKQLSSPMQFKTIVIITGEYDLRR
jgi:hypothetical protein